MGAQHRVVQPPIPEHRSHLGDTGIHTEGGDRLDLQQAVPCQRLDGLSAAQGRATQDPLDRVVLQPDHEPLGLAAPGRRQGPQPVRTLPAALVTGITVPDHDEQAILRGHVVRRSSSTIG
jgi:hypothetical protein